MEDNNTNSGNTNTHLTSSKENFIFKFVILGDSGVGKTSILHHFIFNKCK